MNRRWPKSKERAKWHIIAWRVIGIPFVFGSRELFLCAVTCVYGKQAAKEMRKVTR